MLRGAAGLATLYSMGESKVFSHGYTLSLCLGLLMMAACSSGSNPRSGVGGFGGGAGVGGGAGGSGGVSRTLPLPFGRSLCSRRVPRRTWRLRQRRRLRRRHLLLRSRLLVGAHRLADLHRLRQRPTGRCERALSWRHHHRALSSRCSMRMDRASARRSLPRSCSGADDPLGCRPSVRLGRRERDRHRDVQRPRRRFAGRRGHGSGLVSA